MKTRRFIVILAGVTFSGLLCISPVTAEQTVVCPAGLENTDGDRVPPFNSGHGFPGGFRVQELHLAAAFPPGPFEMTRMAFRPDRIVTAPRTAEWNILAIKLSTTTTGPGELSNRFEDNHGEDVTTVISGPKTVLLETDADGPLAGPRDFDYVFDFDTPFLYDRAQGNLLLEIVSGPNANARPTSHDAHRTPQTQLVLFRAGPDGEFADYSDNAVSVIQFTLVPMDQPTFRRGDSNADGTVNIADGVSTLLYLFAGEQEPSCRDAADTDDSGEIDINDSIGTFNWLFQGAAPPPPPGPDDCGADPTDDSLYCSNPHCPN